MIIDNCVCFDELLCVLSTRAYANLDNELDIKSNDLLFCHLIIFQFDYKMTCWYQTIKI